MAFIFQIESAEDIEHVRELFQEYLEWAKMRLRDEFGIGFYDVETKLEQDMAKLEMFAPPAGRLFLVRTDDQIAGLACMRKISAEIAEIKRMYVRPAFRGRGIGRDLLERLLVAAKRMGYPRMRLDSARFMKEAHSLYRSAGFEEIEPYPESEIPEEYQAHWIFMEKHL